MTDDDRDRPGGVVQAALLIGGRGNGTIVPITHDVTEVCIAAPDGVHWTAEPINPVAPAYPVVVYRRSAQTVNGAVVFTRTGSPDPAALEFKP